MKVLSILFGVIFGFSPLTASGQINASKMSCIPCDELKNLQLPDVTILKVESMIIDTVKSEVPWVPTVILHEPFCRVLGNISKEIAFELLVPHQWNGRFLMAGNGGFAGSIQNDLRNYLNEGYAVAGTNTGHEGSEFVADWALNNMERQLNFGRLAIHRTTVVSKSIIHNYYCADPAYSYFVGCSRGGGQAMVEAQLYPDDFNGIIAGAPAFNWPAFGAKFIQHSQINYPDPNDLSKTTITNDNLKLLQEQVFRQCDKLDELSDKILNDPRDCHFDFDKLPFCLDDKPGANCFTQAQLSAIKSIYSPLLVENKVVYPGLPFGLESEDLSWNFWISGTSPFLQDMPSAQHMFGTNMFKYLIYNDSSWDYSKFDFKDFFKETQYASAYLDATQIDYSAFKNKKGKMIMYHGWNDAAFSAYSTIQHYEEALKKDKDLQSFIRLFLLPGVMHCGGGTGPDKIDWVEQIRDWVEEDKAPERIVLSKVDNGKNVMTRPVYPYPNVTIYSGKGNPNDEKSFILKDIKN